MTIVLECDFFCGIPEEALEALEFDYCLPKYFWSSQEWAEYTRKRIMILNRMNEYKEYKKEYGNE